ncbi:MAG: hypothetical protein HQ485_16825 [Acidobacteria bacterium]|nr:hypothetical protein [Acidobacteriota bacterium]
MTSDGSRVPARALGQGERQLIEAQREVVLQLGSAGSVTWTINGRPGRSLGLPGEVTTVTISSENVSEFWQATAGRPTPSASATVHP